MKKEDFENNRGILNIEFSTKLLARLIKEINPNTTKNG